jgi:hypothetical protein
MPGLRKRISRVKLISIDGELEVAGINARMKLLTAKIKETEDRKKLKLLSREWWRCWFSLHSRSDVVRPARIRENGFESASPQHFNVPTGGRSEAHP